MFRVTPASPVHAESFPRVSGDVPQKSVQNGGHVPFSPRERGCSVEVLQTTLQTGVFPA